MKTVYNKANAREVIAYPDPKESGRYALPANSTEVPPPDFDTNTHTCVFEGSQWVVTEIPIPEPEPTPEPIPAMDQLRMQRNSLLDQTDWMAVSDRVMTQAQIDYRQALRDLPETADPQLDEDYNLTNVTWPSL